MRNNSERQHIEKCYARHAPPGFYIELGNTTERSEVVRGASNIHKWSCWDDSLSGAVINGIWWESGF
jgi:hypothetical protein